MALGGPGHDARRRRGAAAWRVARRGVRMDKKLGDLDPILREVDQYRDFFQYLESQEPILRPRPLRASEFLGFGVPNGQIP